MVSHKFLFSRYRISCPIIITDVSFLPISHNMNMKEETRDSIYEMLCWIFAFRVKNPKQRTFPIIYVNPDEIPFFRPTEPAFLIVRQPKTADLQKSFDEAVKFLGTLVAKTKNKITYTCGEKEIHEQISKYVREEYKETLSKRGNWRIGKKRYLTVPLVSFHFIPMLERETRQFKMLTWDELDENEKSEVIKIMDLISEYPERTNRNDKEFYVECSLKKPCSKKIQGYNENYEGHVYEIHSIFIKHISTIEILERLSVASPFSLLQTPKPQKTVFIEKKKLHVFISPKNASYYRNILGAFSDLSDLKNRLIRKGLEKRWEVMQKVMSDFIAYGNPQTITIPIKDLTIKKRSEASVKQIL